MTRIASLALVAPIALLASDLDRNGEPRGPAVEVARSLVVGHSHAIETNNRALALWYVHPASPWRREMDAALRDQLADYLERARISGFERIALPDGKVAARVDLELVRLSGLKLMRSARQAVYHFRRLGSGWRIWRIETVSE